MIEKKLIKKLKLHDKVRRRELIKLAMEAEEKEFHTRLEEQRKKFSERING